MISALDAMAPLLFVETHVAQVRYDVLPPPAVGREEEEKTWRPASRPAQVRLVGPLSYLDEQVSCTSSSTRPQTLDYGQNGLSMQAAVYEYKYLTADGRRVEMHPPSVCTRIYMYERDTWILIAPTRSRHGMLFARVACYILTKVIDTPF
ncbi:hypothetical protein CMQ_7158 [Grosmannia clavigera kw1407]|uniref:Uncharacterized protein n=1 Tax=Grosmannia clavigera (strain kw1407 / UAMH 11150) TaxID=655863 RepID=F0XPU6_GROCL|nr:uncharacterized protein CMQ_7158 [Grosmannia clavigera kw1407]EFX00156.1 hypothetical protein CMQ_7158 [Grosmannia clavigera kw1407]